MYEVATFTSLQPIDKLHLIAVAEIPALAAMWLFHALATVGILYVGSVLLFSRWFSLLCNEYAPDPVAQVAVVMVGSTCVLACCYGCVCWFVYDKLVEHIRAAQVLKRQLSSFAISDLQCAVESDRVVVEKQIKDLFGTLDKFEALVREKVEPALSKSTVAGWPWWMIILAVSPHAWIGVDSLSLSAWDSEEIWHFLSMLISVTFTGDVLGMYVMGVIARRLNATPTSPDDHVPPPEKSRDNRMTGIVLSTLAYAVINGVLVGTTSPNVPVMWKLPLAVVLAVAAFAITRH
jgi:hypothetical protein